MAKLIIEIKNGEVDNMYGVEVGLSLELAPRGQRQRSDAVACLLAETVKQLLPEITKNLVEAESGRKVLSTSICQDKSLDEVMAASAHAAGKTH